MYTYNPIRTPMNPPYLSITIALPQAAAPPGSLSPAGGGKNMKWRVYMI